MQKPWISIIFYAGLEKDQTWTNFWWKVTENWRIFKEQKATKNCCLSFKTGLWKGPPLNDLILWRIFSQNKYK